MDRTRSGEHQTGHDSEPALGMEILVGYVLLGGVLLSLALLVAGLGWRWIATGHMGLEYSIAGMNLLEFIAKDFRQVAGDDMRPRLLINLGLAALMLTPYARVLASMLYFAFEEHNWKYALFTGFVLSVLTYSLLLR